MTGISLHIPCRGYSALLRVAVNALLNLSSIEVEF